LWSAIYDDNPEIVFEHRLLYPIKEQVPEKIEPIPLGKARVVQEGSDVTVIATGPLVHRSLAAAKQASEEDGISVEIVDPRTLQPLDVETLVASVQKTNRVVVAHEAVTRGGFGAEVTAVLQAEAFDWLDAPIERVGAKFAPLAFAPAMEQYVIPQIADVLAAIRRVTGRGD
jgi:pyruvate dehydrogenase E1 component beta subunit